jgi:hypothetical protein
MSDSCANPCCSALSYRDNGKLFCAEIEISGATYGCQRKTAYIWLCDCCALQMKAKSEVAEDIIRVLLARSCAESTTDHLN